MRTAFATLLAVLLVAGAAFADDNGAARRGCGDGLQVQILGAGGPGAAGDGYLVWIDGQARALIDFGAGMAPRFQQSGARAADLDVVLFTRLHTDQTLDFPALVATTLRSGRHRPLPLYGPTGNRFAPSTVTFVRTLLDGTRGAYRHLGSVLSPLSQDSFKLEPHDVRTPPPRVGVRRNDKEILPVYRNARMRVHATYVNDDDDIPVLAWRLQTQDRRIVFAGAVNGGAPLERLAHEADLLMAHETAPQGDKAGEDRAAAIGRLAGAAQAKLVLLPQRSGSGEPDPAIRAHYSGPLVAAGILDCFPVP